MKDKFVKFSGIKNEEFETEKKKEIESQRTEVSKLSKIIIKIEDLIEDKNDDVSQSIREILNGIEDTAKEFKRASEESSIAAKWLLGHKQSILRAVKHSTISADTSDTFYSEVEKYFELIVESFHRCTYIKPKKRNITFHLQQPFSYIKAIRAIKLQIDQELVKNAELNESEIARLHDCVDRLIENIRSESSSSNL
ncbi:MAG: hypothetical protein DCF25_17355 [Leptolyngbya foveolarum]|uniref:Uncharacterized protein n=1 Tax=Leptolyngbya foveolarum TaxID=47253 RepID=A0A2W4U078_9CYAN|nr:MAG: hypothetical protein DCF25_17355 [Leptolyngbya foveolarum]